MLFFERYLWNLLNFHCQSNTMWQNVLFAAVLQRGSCKQFAYTKRMASIAAYTLFLFSLCFVRETVYFLNCNIGFDIQHVSPWTRIKCKSCIRKKWMLLVFLRWNASFKRDYTGLMFELTLPLNSKLIPHSPFPIPYPPFPFL